MRHSLLTSSLIAVLSSGPLHAQSHRSALASSAPALSFASPERNHALASAYHSALENLLQINTVPIPRRHGEAYNQTGLLGHHPGKFFRAGGGYMQPWTRDASINSWSAGSLLAPRVAKATLLSVLRRQASGKLIVQQDDQWWDQVIWIVGAWNHFLVTGDRVFLTHAYQAATQTLERDTQLHFNRDRGLFEGPAFLNDGIAGYPVPPATTHEEEGSFVLRYAGADRIMVLSTNCIYAAALRAAAAMAEALHRSPPESAAFTSTAQALVLAIRQQFWLPAQGRFAYLLQPDGTLDASQEGAGSAFALLFGVATAEQAVSLLNTVVEQPFGFPDVWPAFPRYSVQQPGRHNNITWPPIMALWAEAAARAGNTGIFASEMEKLAALAAGDRDRFWEIYDGVTGHPSGGWQSDHLWYSEPNQTWSATAYLRMVYAGLFGLRLSVQGLRFAPSLPAGWGSVSLRGLRYRKALLDVELRGSGHTVKAFHLDGRPQAEPALPAHIHGRHTIVIELAET